MSVLGMHIDSLYFRYQPAAGHFPDCARAGTALFEVAEFIWESYDGTVRETSIRLVCRTCGSVKFIKFDGAAGFGGTVVNRIGYGSKPDHVAGLWLHPGPPILPGDDRGPTAYLVTTTRACPADRADVAGVVGWRAGPRGGIRWQAGLGYSEHGHVTTSADQTWASRRAAAAWIAAQLAPTPGDTQ
jgi:hypothetical protein